MTNRFPTILHSRLPILAGAHIHASVSSFNIDSRAQFSRTLKKSKNRSSYRVPRRLVLGIGGFILGTVHEHGWQFRLQFHHRISQDKGAVEQILENVEWPEQFPFKAEDFQRFDESSDLIFYESPRFVTHIDDPAIAALTKYYKEAFPPSNTPGVALLDMCSSWISHYPTGYKQDRIAGMGLNEEELKANKVLTEYVVQDLNTNPKLPYEDNSFDVITNVVSVDYLTKPIEVFKEMHRVLKPGGKAIMSFSNRCFFTKAISIWTSTGDADHIMIVGAYFHYAGGFEPPQAVDISPNPGRSDPMYIVHSKSWQQRKNQISETFNVW